jgi:hydrogenase maturation protease
LDVIVRTLLYEGYLLYPYRPSAVKNRRRFNFGVLYPPACCTAGDTSQLLMACPLRGDGSTRLDVRLRFLQLFERPTTGDGSQGWQEAVERELLIADVTLASVAGQAHRVPFAFPLADASAGAGEQRGEALIRVEQVRAGAYTVTVRISNLTDAGGDDLTRDAALLRSFVSTHVVLQVGRGELISLLDPPDDLRDIAAGCVNVGVWPVLVGEPGSHARMLASPIILYDYPRVASESAGDLFDGTEIDEILALRILTMTDEEKREARSSDVRARQIVDRTEQLTPEQWARLHGAFRWLQPVTAKQS